jgi:hypothetical protein
MTTWRQHIDKEEKKKKKKKNKDLFSFIHFFVSSLLSLSFAQADSRQVEHNY